MHCGACSCSLPALVVGSPLYVRMGGVTVVSAAFTPHAGGVGLGSDLTSVHPPPLVLAFPPDPPRPPVPGLSEFLASFSELFGGAGAVDLDPAL